MLPHSFKELILSRQGSSTKEKQQKSVDDISPILDDASRKTVILEARGLSVQNLKGVI